MEIIHSWGLRGRYHKTKAHVASNFWKFGCPTLGRLSGLCSRKIAFYLPGLPVGGNPRFRKFWSPVLERIERRLERWGKRYLSLGVRVTLLKSVLFNLPTYFFSLFEITKGVANTMEKLFWSFLWGD